MFVFACIYSDHSIYECVCLRSHLYLLYFCPGKCALISSPESSALTHTNLLDSPVLTGKKKIQKPLFSTPLYSFPPFDFTAQVLKRIVCTHFCFLLVSPPSHWNVASISTTGLHNDHQPSNCQMQWTVSLFDNSVACVPHNSSLLKTFPWLPGHSSL